MTSKPRLLAAVVLPIALLAPLALVWYPRRGVSCGHIILFTQARHGSTWLLDSVERCRFSRAEQVERGVYGKRVFLDTELWHVQNSSLKRLPVRRALAYVTHNCSVKLFPTALRRPADVRKLLSAADRVPVVVLRRDPRRAWDSLKRAERSGHWANVLSQTQSLRNAVRARREDFEQWAHVTERYFDSVAHLLREEDVEADWLWYEDVKDLVWVELRAARCFVRNCNFL